jgi:hypothetical protein
VRVQVPDGDRERDVLDPLLRFDGGEAFAAQLDAVQVVGGCPDCPCPTVELRVDSRVGILVARST